MHTESLNGISTDEIAERQMRIVTETEHMKPVENSPFGATSRARAWTLCDPLCCAPKFVHGHVGWYVIVGVVCLATMATLSSCRSNSRVDGLRSGTEHPTADNFPTITDHRHLLHEEEATQQILDVTGLSSLTIGVNEGRQQDMLGSIGDVVLRHGSLFYLDSEYAEVRVYDHSGSLQSIVGGPGSGPGGFVDAAAMAVTEDGLRIVVWDTNSRIQVFQKQDSTYALEQSFQGMARYAAQSGLCVMNGHIYIIGYGEELKGIIHKHTLAGEYVDSFGAAYKSPVPFVRDFLSSSGSLTCSSRRGIVGYVNSFVPVLTGYAETGAIAWQVRFSDMQLRHVEEEAHQGRPSVVYHAAREGESMGLSTLEDAFTNSFIAHYHVQGDNSSVGTRHYFKVDAQLGQGAYLGQRIEHQNRSTPLLIALGKEYVYTSYSYPFPHIEFYKRSDVLPW